MNKSRLLSAGCALLALISLNSHAVVIGPDYPPPGGVSWSGSGSGTSGTATWNYSGFNTSAFNELYFGLNQSDYGALGAGLDNSPSPFSLYGVSGQTAEWRADTLYYNPVTLLHEAATTRLVMTITGLGATPWITDLASIGMDVGFGDLGAVADNSGGTDFTLTWAIEANVGSGWQSINSISQHLSHDGYTNTSFATGFYSVVPVPAALWLFGSGLIGLIGVARRKNSI